MRTIPPLLSDETKHKKKSQAKGQPRSKHKHEYKTVLLHCLVPNFNNSSEFHEILSATKVCSICGRISENDFNQYEDVKIISDNRPFSYIEKRIKNPESLENWYAYGYVPKKAYRTLKEAEKEKTT